MQRRPVSLRLEPKIRAFINGKLAAAAFATATAVHGIPAIADMSSFEILSEEVAYDGKKFGDAGA